MVPLFYHYPDQVQSPVKFECYLKKIFNKLSDTTHVSNVNITEDFSHIVIICVQGF